MSRLFTNSHSLKTITAEMNSLLFYNAFRFYECTMAGIKGHSQRVKLMVYYPIIIMYPKYFSPFPHTHTPFVTPNTEFRISKVAENPKKKEGNTIRSKELRRKTRSESQSKEPSLRETDAPF